MSSYAATKAAENLRFALGTIEAFAKNWPVDKHAAMPSAHDKHLLWNIGHLATSNDWFFSLMTGETGICPEAWHKLFGMGSKPQADAKLYPPLGELMAKLTATVERFASELAKRSDAELSRAPAGDAHGMAKDRLDAAHRAAWHLGWHLGQIANTRNGLGLPPVLS